MPCFSFYIGSNADLGNPIVLVSMDPIPNAGLSKEMVTIFIEILDLATDVDSRKADTIIL